MLSDEEKKAIESLIEIREFANLSSYKDTKISQLNAIDVVLNLIEKQSKEIEELKQDRDEYKEEYIKLQNARYYNYISKDKIKSKIDEVDKDENASIPDFIEYAKEYATQKLQSLLEKE